MEQRSVIHSTFVIERSYPVAVERVFSAFDDPQKKRRWFVEGPGFETRSHQMDFREGGTETSSFLAQEGPVKGATITNETVFQDIVPNRRIIFAYTMSMNGKRFSASLATVELVAAGGATNLIFTEQGAFFENADGPAMRKAGWRELLDALGKELAR